MGTPSSALHCLSSEMTSWSLQSEFLVVRCFVSARTAYSMCFLIFILARGRDVSCGTFFSFSLAFSATSNSLDVSVREFTTSYFQEKTIKAMSRCEKGQTWSWNITTDIEDPVQFPKSKSKSPSASRDFMQTSLSVSHVHTGGYCVHPSWRGVH